MEMRMFARALLLILCLAATPHFVAAQEAPPTESSAGWVDPGWRRVVGRNTTEFDTDGNSRMLWEFELHLLDEKGARAQAQQTFHYNSYFYELSLSDLATLKADGRVIPVDEKAIRDQPAVADLQSPYLDEQRLKLVPFADVAPGDRIRGKALFKSKRPYFPGDFANFWGQSPAQPPETFELTLIGPAAKPLNIVARGVEHQQSREGERIIHKVLFKQTNPRPIKNALDVFDVAARFEASTFKDYASFAAQMHARNAPMAVPDAAITTLSASIVGDVSAPRAKVERIHNWVAKNIRYVGIGFENGGWTSQPAPTVLEARYGDCKAHATLLKALLAAQGIEANFIGVNAGTRFSLSEVATANFNHAITYVPSLDLYLDATAANVAFGTLPASLYGKPVLNIDTGVLGRIPPAKVQAFQLEVATAITLAPDGTRKGESVMTGTGRGAVYTRALAQGLERVDRAEAAKRKITDANLEGSGDYRFDNPRELADRFILKAPFTITRALDFQKRPRIRVAATTYPGQSLLQLTTGNTRGRAFNCVPLDYRNVAVLDLPPGVNVEEKPAPLSFKRAVKGKTAYGEVTGTIDLRGDVVIHGRQVRIERRAVFDFSAPVCSLEMAEEIRTALLKWGKHNRGQIRLTTQPVEKVVEKSSDDEE